MVFVAVNSGNRASSVQSYLSSVHCNWPAIVDEDRSFERACGVGVISLQNIWQTAIITPEGRLVRGQIDRLDSCLETARWKIDPSGIPPALKETWRALEFGKVAKAVSLFNATKDSGGAEEAALGRLEEVIAERLANRMTAAVRLEDNGMLAQANTSYRAILRDFDGFDHVRLVEASDAIQRLIPQLLEEVWRSLELGTEAAYPKLIEEIGRMLAVRLAAARSLVEQDELWEATKAYQGILATFDGFDRSSLREASDALRELNKSDQVKNETAAGKAFVNAKAKFLSPSARKNEQGQSELRKLIEDYPGTEAAREADRLLGSEQRSEISDES